jgi:mono/diheme cytochrome c family protein
MMWTSASLSRAGACVATLLMFAAGTATSQTTRDTILLGRELVINHACAGCHGGHNPVAEVKWLAGMQAPLQEFYIGACSVTPGAKPCFLTRARNLTPDNATGIGRFSERQIFNALRFGLRPGETPDVTISSNIPGTGNFPANPRYLAPPMPWPSWRYMSDRELWAIAAYLKRGLKPVSNKVPDSEGPPDFWASEYTPEKLGPYPAPPFPAAYEQEPK